MKMSVLPNWSTGSAQSQSKFQWPFCINWQVYHKFTWKFKNLEMSKKLWKGTKSGHYQLLISGLNYKPSEIKTEWYWPAAAAAKSLHSCPTLCDPIDGSPPGSPIPGILQARTLEWVAISFSKAWKWKVARSCPTLPNPMDCSLPGSPAHGIFQARVLSGVSLPSPILA